MRTKKPSQAPTPAKKIRFDPSTFEDDIRDYWEKEQVYVTVEPSSEREKEYILAMFPYTSGDGVHTGHARIYTGTDVLARFYRMQGKAVLHPTGWDAFGLPAENAAIKKKTNPRTIVPQYIANFKRQFKNLGISYDWDKEINTTDPRYYGLTQQLFILFFKHGLLYKKDTPVYYCPFCKTGLAQEEVEGNGTHERCGNEVERRNLPQWIFRIREYAESLLDGLEGLDWPRGILEMQKNWIGRKEGMNITYPIDGTNEEVTCFTTRADTQYGATFIVLAPEHSLTQKMVAGDVKIPADASRKDIETYVKTALRKTERERMAEEKKKTGVFTGLYAVNRLNGEKLPVWISDFVLVNVGTGAVVGVPAHDKRDYEFAASFDIPVKRVVVGPDGNKDNVRSIEDVFEGEGDVVNSDSLDELTTEQAYEKIAGLLEDKAWGTQETTYHLRDWIFSRQRYWGEPIPMVYCQSCAKKKVSYWNSDKTDKRDLRLSKGPNGKDFESFINDIEERMYGWFPLSLDELPLELPDIESYEPTETGASPLSHVKNWVETTCPECAGIAVRETDTMPNWAGSNWYFLAFPMAQAIAGGRVDSEELFKGIVNKTMPVDWYIGGAEHAVLHLLYARFWMHVFHDLGLVKVREPFIQLVNVGMVQAEDGRKMSKSLGNVVNPDDVIDEYGADALRVYEMFMAPFGQEIAWSTQTLQGSYRFVRRIWQIYHSPAKMADSEKKEDKRLASELQRVIEKVSKDIPDVKFNTPISSMMEFLNMWEKGDTQLSKGHAKAFLKLLAPFAPYVTEKIWQDIFSEKGSIHNAQWPVVDESLVQKREVELPIQVNGKVRDRIMISAEATEDEALEKALKSEKIKKWVGTSKHSVVYVPGRILNIVLGE